MRYHFVHAIDTDLESFWNEVYFDPEFNRALYLSHLQYSFYRVLEERTDADGTRHRRIECSPKVDIPPSARKIIGEATSYVEVGRFDPAARRYRIDVIPAFGGDKLKTSTEIWGESMGAKRIERHATGDANVKMFGLGGLIESLIEKQAREIHEKSADFTNQWIRDKGF